MSFLPQVGTHIGAGGVPQGDDDEDDDVEDMDADADEGDDDDDDNDDSDDDSMDDFDPLKNDDREYTPLDIAG